MTNRDKIIAGLTALGFVQVDARTSKYLVFKEPGSNNNAYLVGKSGALRKTTTGTVSKSISLTGSKVCNVIMTVGQREYKNVQQAREDFGVLLSS